MIPFKHLIFIAFYAFLLGTGPAFAAAPQGYVHEVSGDVQARIGASKPVPVEKNQNLGNNTTITTGPKSNVVLKFIDGTVVALNENTSFQIQKYEYNEKSPSSMTALFSMVRGALRVITGAMSTRNRDGFKVATPSATIGIRGTEFLAQTMSPLITQTISGTTTVTNAVGTTLVGPGQIVSVATSTSVATTLTALPPGAFGNLPGLSLPAATPVGVPAGAPGAAGAAGAPGAVGAGAGGIGAGGVAVGAAAAAAAAAAGSSGTPGATGTTGTTGTTP